MDFITHAALGGLIGRGLAPVDGESTDVSRWTRLGALVALLPDADHVLEAISAEAYLIHHRTFSHSFVAGLVVVGLAAGLARDRRGRVAAVVAASFGSHLLLDVLTPFGTGLWWPFSGSMPALDGLWIVGPWLLALTALAAIAATGWGRRGRRDGRFAAVLGMAAIAGFLGLEIGMSRRAGAATPGAVVLSGPSWKNPLAGVSFAVDADRSRLVVYEVGVDGVARAIRQPARCDVVPPDSEVEAARTLALPFVQRLRVPVARATGTARQVVFEDAQYWPVDPRHAPFTVAVDLETEEIVVTERGRGLQIVLYLLVVAFAVGLTRGSSRRDG
jgi:membrane-bound metal-dependent hydrolase YbcI (DUF457 family)